MEIITHSNFNKALYTNNGLKGNEKLLMSFLFQKYFENKNNNNFYQLDDYVAQALGISRDTLIRVRKSLTTKGLISTQSVTLKGKKVLYYTINYDKILNTPTEQEITTPHPTPQENPIITPTEVKDESCAPEVNTQPLSSIELLPPTPLTNPKVEKFEENPIPQPEEKKEIDLEGIFSDFESISPKNDIVIPNNEKVSEIAQNNPLNEDEQNTLNLAYTKDNNNNEKSKEIENDMNTDNFLSPKEKIVMAFTKDELKQYAEQGREGLDKEDSEFKARFAEVKNMFPSRPSDEYIWSSLEKYHSKYIDEESPANEVVVESPVEEDEGVPLYIRETLREIYLHPFKERVKDENDNDIEVTKLVLRPYRAIKTLYKTKMQKYGTEDRKLFARYAQLIYNDCKAYYSQEEE